MDHTRETQPDAKAHTDAQKSQPANQMSLKDDRLEQRALREGWPITPEMRAKLLARLGEILDQPTSTAREISAVARALAAVDRINHARQPPDPANQLDTDFTVDFSAPDISE